MNINIDSARDMRIIVMAFAAAEDFGGKKGLALAAKSDNERHAEGLPMVESHKAPT